MEEEDELHQGGQLCKFPKVGNEELEHGGGGGGGGRREGLGGFNSNWNHSSRIIRVSRASGGKDRHSKVMTSKGLRDRRVRLSVTTAIQFYDLQDRLGYDQPSKAVEWLIKSASDAISELPSLNNTFPDTLKQPSDEKRAFNSSDAEVLESNNNNNNNANYQQNQNLSLSKSGCSSNSETSKGSGLSLARSDIRVNRVKARERARTRTAKEKEVKEVNEQPSQSHSNNNNNVPHQTASFTELLTGGMNNTNSPGESVHHHHHHYHHHNQGNNDIEARQQWSTAPMDYFSPMLLGTSSRTQQQHHQTSSTGFSLLSLPEHQAMSLSQFNSDGENHYSFIPHDQHQHQHQHLMPSAVVTSSMNEYNLNFTISSSNTTGLNAAGYNRGTLQSNSPSLLPHQLQRFSTIDGSSSSSSSTLPFFMGHGVAAQPPQHAPSTNTTMENNQHHHQFSSPFDANRLHLCYGDACRHSDQKGKPKN